VNLLHLRAHLEGETLSLSTVFCLVKARHTNREHVETKHTPELDQSDPR
jgi:hypothetical protein